MKKILGIIICFCIYTSTYAGCIPKYSVYEYKNQTVHMGFENINQTLIEGPIYNIENFKSIGGYSWCNDINISDSKEFNMFSLEGKDNIYYLVNFIVLILGIFLSPLLISSLLIYKYVKNLFIKTFLFFILYSSWIIIFVWYFALLF